MTGSLPLSHAVYYCYYYYYWFQLETVFKPIVDQNPEKYLVLG